MLMVGYVVKVEEERKMTSIDMSGRALRKSKAQLVVCKAFNAKAKKESSSTPQR